MATVTLNSGAEVPALGLGVFQTSPDETRYAVRGALGARYRFIDTAAAYGNEREVGEAVQGSALERSEVFLETKIWISGYGYYETLSGFEKGARKLGVDKIDLLILHQAPQIHHRWPWPARARLREAMSGPSQLMHRSAATWEASLPCEDVGAS